MLFKHYKQTLYSYKISLKKYHAIKDFFPGFKIKRVYRLEKIPFNSTVIIWGSRNTLVNFPENIKIISMEDGFLRSVGLGADLIRPLSLVKDSQGIYFDSTRPSDLEYMLKHEKFSAELLKRAKKIREQIVNYGLTKYNTGKIEWNRPRDASKVILVPGQVESDASIRLGSPTIFTNIALLQAVFRANPNAYIIYKPHPDVQAGLRLQGENEVAANQWCNEILADVSMNVLLPKVDEVHLLTSLTGFEALLRQKKVVCYGQPFYAGWGLTEDKTSFSNERRNRCLALDELVAATLIMYPTYVSLKTKKQISIEEALGELLEWRDKPVSIIKYTIQKFLRLLLRRLAK